MLDFPIIRGRFFTSREVDVRARVVILGEDLKLFTAEDHRQASAD